MDTASSDTKHAEQTLDMQLSQYADMIGGKNFFMTLAETIRTTREEIMLLEKRQINYPRGTMTWNKTLHANNWRLLVESAKVRTKEGNILLPAEDKRHKNILNMIRSLKPLIFTVMPANADDGNGFSFAALEVIDNQTTLVSPLFKALFTMPIDVLRKKMA
jgi:hypothetical protein